MDYLAAMRSFVRSVDLGSFSAAAAESGAKVSTVSRHIAGLEADLGAALLNRSTRRLHLTEVGRAFYERSVRILAEVADARGAASQMNSRPQGVLRVNLPGAFGRLHVMPRMPRFLAEHPEIRLDATLTDMTVDLIETGSDVAIRIGSLPDSSLVAKKLAPHRRILCASPEYLARAGAVAAPADLARQDCLIFTLQPGETWHFRSRASAEAQHVVVTGRLRANESEALLACALAGQGIALLPRWLVWTEIRAGRLAPLLPEWEVSSAADFERAIWAVYPPKKIVAPKLRAFLDYLQSCFGRPAYWEL